MASRPQIAEMLKKMEDLKLEAENRLRGSRQRRRADALAWMEQARKKMAERADLRKKLASTPAGDKVLTKKMEVKVTLSQISLEWRETHKKERCSFLFHEVFPLLYQGGDLKGEDIKKFRLMSTQTQKSVDTHLSNDLQPHRYFRNEANVESMRYITPFIPRFFLSTQIANFNNWSRSYYPCGNPFFARKLTLGAIPGQDMIAPWIDNQEYWKKAEILLCNWGQQIWQFQIRFDRSAPIDVYRQLYRLLILMPNLRSLILEDQNRSAPEITLQMKTWRSLGQEVYRALKEEIKKCPLPELPYLTHFTYISSVPSPITHAILSKYHRKLEMICGVPTIDFAVSNDELLKVFRTISNAAPPATFEGPFGSLEEIVLKYSFVGDVDAIPDIFKNVNDCGPSVGRLTLLIENDLAPIVKLSEPILKSLSLELPNLESIRLSVIRVNLSNIDFLLPCRSLKEIILKYSKMSKKMTSKNESKQKKGSSGSGSAHAAPGEVIQFTGYANRLYESNVWELFPELELVSIEVTNLLAALGKGPGRPPVMQAGDIVASGENPLLPHDSITKAKLYTRDGFVRRQLKKDLD